MQMATKAKQLCRLCVEPCSMDVTTSQSIQDPELYSKLVSVFHFALPVEESLPDAICSVCFYKVTEWYSYHETVQFNQHQLRDTALGEEECKAGIALKSVKVEVNEEESQDRHDPVAHVEVKLEQGFDDDDESDASESSEEPIPKRTKRKYTKRSAADLEKKKPDEEKLKRTAEENRKIREFFKLACEVCSEPFEELYRLQQHSQKKHGVRASIKCCNLVLCKKWKIIEHIDSHLYPGQFRCNACDKTYKNKRMLDLHNLKSHTVSEEKPFKCEKCQRSFPKEYLLKAHLRTHVQAECTICHRMMANAFSLQCHIEKMHSERETLICETCGQEFRTKLGMEQHVLKHQGITVPVERVQCHICSKWINGKRYLKIHIQNVHTEESQPVTCDICHQMFPNQRAMIRHKGRVHVEEKFECEFCGKKFKRKVHLKEHRASHTGEALYSCDVCGMTTNSNGNLYTHKKNKHPEEWLEAKKKAIELAYG